MEMKKLPLRRIFHHILNERFGELPALTAINVAVIESWNNRCREFCFSLIQCHRVLLAIIEISLINRDQKIPYHPEKLQSSLYYPPYHCK